ncbi:hypothetical protein ACLB2K_050622 [Fragaria x ananassa]
MSTIKVGSRQNQNHQNRFVAFAHCRVQCRRSCPLPIQIPTNPSRLLSPQPTPFPVSVSAPRPTYSSQPLGTIRCGVGRYSRVEEMLLVCPRQPFRMISRFCAQLGKMMGQPCSLGVVISKLRCGL